MCVCVRACVQFRVIDAENHAYILVRALSASCLIIGKPGTGTITVHQCTRVYAHSC